MRWVAGIVGGFIAALVLYFEVSMVAKGPQVWVLPAGWALLGWWFVRSRPRPWSRLWLTLALMCFALPLASIALSSRIGADLVAGTQNDAKAAGAVVGSFLAGTVVAGIAGFVGFFLGIIFALLAYFTGRGTEEANAGLTS